MGFDCGRRRRGVPTTLAEVGGILSDMDGSR